MVGVTHPTMGNLQVDVHRVYGSENTTFTLRSRVAADATDNNFTSYDLFNTAGISKDDFGLPKAWSLHAIDKMRFDRGQIEYLQLQVTLRTLPNRADTDADGVNDSEELKLRSRPELPIMECTAGGALDFPRRSHFQWVDQGRRSRHP